MRDRDYTISVDFLNRFFGDAEGVVELRACANERGGAQSLFTRDPAEIASFARRKDVPGTGTYFGIATRRKGATSGSKQDVLQVPALWVDIDCAKQGIGGQEALDALNFLPHPPTIIVNSGGGLHAYWMLEEAVDVAGDYHAVERLCRQLALILAGDTSCAEIARILRLPGTDNSKDATRALNDGDPATCEVLSDTGTVYDFDTLAEWLADQRAVLHAAKHGVVKAVQEDDPFVAYARAAGYEPAIDVEAELTAMADGNIHQTQLRVSMSLIARGYDDDEIVSMVLAATEQAAPGNAAWNWDREERAIRKMVRSGRAKAVDRDERTPQRAKSVPMAANDGNAARKLELVHDADKQPKTKSKPAQREKTDQTTALGSAVLEVWQERHGPVIHGGGNTYVYEAGIWLLWDERHDQLLRIMLQEACCSLNMAPKTALLNGAAVYFMNRPSLLVSDIAFDKHDLIIAGDGVLDPISGEIEPHSPDHRASFKVGAALHGKRECPTFLCFLEESFADKPAAEVPQIISTLQEWFGSCLVPKKPRALSKGLFAYGGSRTGKTQLSEIARALLGAQQTTATSAAEIGGDFGLQTFLGKRGWIADDAISQGDYLHAERYKKIITGEEIGVSRKNKTQVQERFGFPVLLTSNHLPRIRDQSDAFYNRSLLLPMTVVRPEHMPEPAGYISIAAKIVAEELTGILWWAVEGWKRLSARGTFQEPPCMRKAKEDMERNNNHVKAWLTECAEENPRYKVATADLFASFAGWYYQENGDGKFPWAQNGFVRVLTELLPNLRKQSGAKTRNLIGIKVNEEGLEYWSINASRDSHMTPKGASVDTYTVNKQYDADKAEKAFAQRSADRSPKF